MATDSGDYSEWADILIKHDFNLVAYSKDINFPPLTPYIYLGFVSCVALAKVTAGLFWPQLIVLMNTIMGALVGVMIADLIYAFTKSKISVWAVLILYVFNPEIFPWTRYILGDTSFMFVNFLAFYFICKMFLKNSAHRIRYWIFVLLIFFCNCIWRPVGFVMTPVVLFTFYLSRRKKEISWKAVFVCFTILMSLSILIYIVAIRNILPVLPGKSVWRDFMVNTYHEGIIIDGRPHTYHYAPSTLVDYVFVTVDRFVHFFYFSDPQFSFRHTLLNTLIFVPMYSLFFLVIIGIIKERDSSIKRLIIALCIIVVLLYSLFYSIVQIDSDWRYRLLIYPYLLVVSGAGMKFLLQKIRIKGV